MDMTVGEVNVTKSGAREQSGRADRNMQNYGRQVGKTQEPGLSFHGTGLVRAP